MSTLSRALLLSILVMLVVGGLVFGVAVRRVNRVHDVPAPPISRATAPDEIARGGRLFRTLCLDCHAGPAAAPAGAGGPAAPRPAAGARVPNAPSFLGELWAPNLTSDREAGVGAWTDGELARLIRNGVRRDGHYAATMPRFSRISDEDVAALIGFMRSDDPIVAPVAARVPPSKLGVGGILALAYAAGVDVGGPAHVPAPPRAATADYGRYLASVIYGCVDCHTGGFGSTDEKLAAPGRMAGGQVLHGRDGAIVYSRNLTPDAATGLGSWSADDLARALREGTTPEGRRLREPMPHFRDIDDTDARALYAFLHGLPPSNSPLPAPAPSAAGGARAAPGG